ncbi:MAG: cytochrome c oxidase subunit II [Betaproteobacteria bacterium]|nr:cytochrome c oxidase subunit II [Betaproteobacteria bacterium]MDH5210590.1 cytochrome c oxidase subunit II [Betaproteobacteria bacterium]
MLRKLFVGALGLALCGLAVAAEWNLQPAASKIAADIHWLHEAVMVLVVVLFVGVFGFMFWSCYAHRKSVGHKAAQFHENTTVEVIWTVVPAIILVLIAWPVTKVVIAQKDTSHPELTIKVTGIQWKWAYDYLKGEGEGISFVSTLSTPRAQIENREAKGENYLLEVDNELVVPVGKKVRMLTTAADVIHSWWVPAFGAKQDAIPGFIRDLWFTADKTGTYRSQCVELCGKDHGFMPIVVRVVSPEDYTKWVGAQKLRLAKAAEDETKAFTLAELQTRGEKVYAANCVACHQANGRGVPPAFPPLDGSKLVLGPKDAQIDVILNGVTKNGAPTAMAAFGKQLSNVELAAVITFTRNNWGNSTGEAVQPADIKARRK